MKFRILHKKAAAYAVVAAVFVACMVFATLYDFEISAFFTKLEKEPLSITVSSFSLVMEVIGEWPSLFFGSFCAGIIIRALIITKKREAYICSAFLVLVIFVLMIYGAFASARYISGTISSVSASVCVSVSALLSFAVIFAVLRIPNETAKRLLVPAIICGTMLAILFLGIQLIKSVFGRIRLRELVELGDISLFTPWYKPRFFSGSHSFPSGHTANAVALAFVPIFYKKDGTDGAASKKLTYLTYMFVAVWSLVMALTRINAGAHYFSDVLVGACLALVAVTAGNYIWKKVCEE